jgi:RNA polymerase sigma factor (sigma-70 family)
MIDRNAPFDLGMWYPDIKKIVTKKYRSFFPNPEDMADIVQDICLALVRKNTSEKCCYKALKSSPSRYILLVASNVINTKYTRGKNKIKTESLERLVAETPKLLKNMPEQSYSPEKFLQMGHRIAQFKAWMSAHDPQLTPYFKMLYTGHKYAEISKAVGKAAGTIRAKVEKAISSFLSAINPFSTHSIFGIEIRVKHWYEA